MILVLLLFGSSLSAQELRIAVASNFKPTLQQLVEAFQARQPADIQLSAASTGKLYAQITHGAPYDLFLAADELRPGKLEQAGLTLAGSRSTYALGQLVLWVPGVSSTTDPEKLLNQGLPLPLAMANPKTAPYGLAARQFLESAGHWERLETEVVRGENIGQAYNFIASGAAASGLVALSQLTLDVDRRGLVWRVPTSSYQPIIQQMVLLPRAANKPLALEFARFLVSEPAREIIRSAGYQVDMGAGS